MGRPKRAANHVSVKRNLPPQEAAPSPMARDFGLTLDEAAFVESYLGEAQGVAWKAMRATGFHSASKGTLTFLGSRMLHRPSVQACLADAIQNSIMNANQLITKICDVITCDIDDYFTMKSGRYQFDIEHARKQGKLSMIQSITMKDGDITIKLPSKLEAMHLLAKYHGVLIDRVSVEIKPDVDMIRQDILDKLNRAIDNHINKNEPKVIEHVVRDGYENVNKLDDKWIMVSKTNGDALTSNDMSVQCDASKDEVFDSGYVREANDTTSIADEGDGDGDGVGDSDGGDEGDGDGDERNENSVGDWLSHYAGDQSEFVV